MEDFFVLWRDPMSESDSETRERWARAPWWERERESEREENRLRWNGGSRHERRSYYEPNRPYPPWGRDDR